MRVDLQTFLGETGYTVQELHDAVHGCLLAYTPVRGFGDFPEFFSCLAVRERLPGDWRASYPFSEFWQGRYEGAKWWEVAQHRAARLTALAQLREELRVLGAVYAPEA